MSEDQLERECLGWLGELGYTHLYEPDIAHDSSDRQHASDPEVALAPRRRPRISIRPESTPCPTRRTPRRRTKTT